MICILGSIQETTLSMLLNSPSLVSSGSGVLSLLNRCFGKTSHSRSTPNFFRSTALLIWCPEISLLRRGHSQILAAAYRQSVEHGQKKRSILQLSNGPYRSRQNPVAHPDTIYHWAIVYLLYRLLHLSPVTPIRGWTVADPMFIHLSAILVCNVHTTHTLLVYTKRI